jgi:hypothetical protein
MLMENNFGKGQRGLYGNAAIGRKWEAFSALVSHHL